MLPVRLKPAATLVSWAYGSFSVLIRGESPSSCSRAEENLSAGKAVASPGSPHTPHLVNSPHCSTGTEHLRIITWNWGRRERLRLPPSSFLPLCFLSSALFPWCFVRCFWMPMFSCCLQVTNPPPVRGAPTGRFTTGLWVLGLTAGQRTPCPSLTQHQVLKSASLVATVTITPAQKTFIYCF